jgi:lipoyl(octanoyl) transferase
LNGGLVQQDLELRVHGDAGSGAPAPIGWHISDEPVAYAAAVSAMETRIGAIFEGRASEHVWLLEHPALYTAGTSAKPADLLDAGGLPVFTTGRGGQYTYHGPGQRIGYVMLNLRQRGNDVRAYVRALERWLIGTLARFGVTGETRPDRVGVWVRRPGLATGQWREDKIAAIGVRIRRGVTMHGVSLNVEPDLGRFAGIVPCGIREHGVTSLADLGIHLAMTEVDVALRLAFEAEFGVTADAID